MGKISHVLIISSRSDFERFIPSVCSRVVISVILWPTCNFQSFHFALFCRTGSGSGAGIVSTFVIVLQINSDVFIRTWRCSKFVRFSDNSRLRSHKRFNKKLCPHMNGGHVQRAIPVPEHIPEITFHSHQTTEPPDLNRIP